jgi:hypothetical protein
VALTPAQKKAADARYYERHRDACVARAQARYASQTPEERRADRRRIRLANPVAHGSRNVSERLRLRADVVAAYGGACACCGNSYEPHLQLDHVADDGYVERALGINAWRKARQGGYPDRYQLLCANCNQAKRVLGACGCRGARLEAVG